MTKILILSLKYSISGGANNANGRLLDQVKGFFFVFQNFGFYYKIKYGSRLLGRVQNCNPHPDSKSKLKRRIKRLSFDLYGL